MNRLLLALFSVLVLGGAALADGPVYPPVMPYPTIRPNIDNQSSTVAVTSTFQQVFPANGNRADCLIQNNGSNNMWVFPGTVAAATKAKSIVLAAGQAFYCAFNSITYTGIVSLTGTAADAYYATGK